LPQNPQRNQFIKKLFYEEKPFYEDNKSTLLIATFIS